MTETDRRGLATYIAVSALLLGLILGIPHLGSAPVTPWSPIGKDRARTQNHQDQNWKKLQRQLEQLAPDSPVRPV
jgi:hypothetical protein